MTHFKDAAVLAEVSEGLGEAMVGLTAMESSEQWATRESGIKGRYQPFRTSDGKELEA